MRIRAASDPLDRPALQITMDCEEVLSYLGHLTGVLHGSTTEGRSEFDCHLYLAVGNTAKHIVAVVAHSIEAELISPEDVTGTTETLRHAKFYLGHHQAAAEEWFARSARQPASKMERLLNEKIDIPGYPGIGEIQWEAALPG